MTGDCFQELGDLLDAQCFYKAEQTAVGFSTWASLALEKGLQGVHCGLMKKWVIYAHENFHRV